VITTTSANSLPALLCVPLNVRHRYRAVPPPLRVCQRVPVPIHFPSTLPQPAAGKPEKGPWLVFDLVLVLSWGLPNGRSVVETDRQERGSRVLMAGWAGRPTRVRILWTPLVSSPALGSLDTRRTTSPPPSPGSGGMTAGATPPIMLGLVAGWIARRSPQTERGPATFRVLFLTQSSAPSSVMMDRRHSATEEEPKKKLWDYRIKPLWSC